MTKHEIRVAYDAGLRLIPNHMRDGVTRYMEFGIEPGSFLLTLLQCGADSDEAWRLADMVNKSSINEWALFLEKHMPEMAWGSNLKVAAWKKMGGLRGYPDA